MGTDDTWSSSVSELILGEPPQKMRVSESESWITNSK